MEHVPVPNYIAPVFAILVILFRFGDLFVIAQIDNFINCIQLLGFLNWVFSQCFAPVFCLLLIAFAVTVSFIIVSVDIAVSVARPL